MNFLYNNTLFFKRCLRLNYCYDIHIIMSLYDIDTLRLKAPLVCSNDFVKAMQRSHSSVSPDELNRFVQWTEEFGQEG